MAPDTVEKYATSIIQSMDLAFRSPREWLQLHGSVNITELVEQMWKDRQTLITAVKKLRKALKSADDWICVNSEAVNRLASFDKERIDALAETKDLVNE